MSNVIEAAVRGVVTAGMTKMAAFNRARARTGEAHPYLTGIHTPMTEELTLEKLAVVGKIPAGLDGRYLRIGPNPVRMPNPARYHWFTGDGMVHGVRLKGGEALWYRNRWVRTTHVSAALGEARAPGERLRESAVNTNVVGVGEKIFALVEAGGAPVELDGALATVAHNPFGGTLRHAFSAHPHRDPETGEMHAICYDALDRERVFHVVVGADGRVIREEAVAVSHGPSIHDCAITKQYVLVFDLPVTLSMPAMLAGYEFPYRWDETHAARVGLLAREGRGEDVVWCDVAPYYVYHPCNAFEREDGRVVVDVVVHNKNSHRDFRGPDGEVARLERWVIDPVARHVARIVVDETAQEFPRMDERLVGKAYRYAYSLCVAAGAADTVAKTSILKHDLEAGTRQIRDFGVGKFPGEFVFVPKAEDSAEDEGWLMGLVVDSAHETTELVILDAQDFEGEAVARVLLPHRVPPGFHGNWVPAVSG